jgi:hypothetical protein
MNKWSFGDINEALVQDDRLFFSVHHHVLQDDEFVLWSRQEAHQFSDEFLGPGSSLCLEDYTKSDQRLMYENG